MVDVAFAEYVTRDWNNKRPHEMAEIEPIRQATVNYLNGRRGAVRLIGRSTQKSF